MSYPTESQLPMHLTVRRVWQVWRQRILGFAAISLCGFCSCSAMDRQPPQDPFLESEQVSAQDSATSFTASRAPRFQPRVSTSATVRLQSPSEFEDAQQPRKSSVAGRVRLPNLPSRPSSGPGLAPPVVAPPNNARQSSIVQTSGQNVRPVSNTDRAIERVAASARTPAQGVHEFAPGFCEDDGPSSVKYPDEYLFDGGDRNYPITRDGDQFQGVETEDTVAEYKDHEGKSKVKKSNRVAIYSPRFGSVVMIHSPNADTIVDKAVGHSLAQQGLGMRSRLSTDEKRQTVDSVRLQTRSRPTNVGTEVGTSALSKEVNREVGISVLKTHQSRGQWARSEFSENLKAVTSQGRLFAELWSRRDFPVMEGHAVGATQSIRLQATAELVGLEDKGKRGELLLTKSADRGEASIGDVITFTIQYENRGDRDLKNVVIIDNLSPRLEFVADSLSTDRPGKHSVYDNDEGSVVIKFALDENLPGRTKGLVTFKCRVK